MVSSRFDDFFISTIAKPDYFVFSLCRTQLFPSHISHVGADRINVSLLSAWEPGLEFTVDGIRPFWRATGSYKATVFLSRWCQTATGHRCPNKRLYGQYNRVRWGDTIVVSHRRRCVFLLRGCQGMSERRWSCTFEPRHQNHSGFKSVAPLSQTHRSFTLCFWTVGEAVTMVGLNVLSWPDPQKLWICVCCVHTWVDCFTMAVMQIVDQPDLLSWKYLQCYFCCIHTLNSVFVSAV